MRSLLFEFEDLLITTLPPLKSVEELSVGRMPDCDLLLDDPSVSKHHALLRWSEPEGRCTVRDLGSTNGTFLNAHTIGSRESSLADGDILSFGNVQFWYLLTETLHARLRGNQPVGLRSYSG
jgi:pSer/pThr/pTyr-binding forkhead associated (FHA) protein